MWGMYLGKLYQPLSSLGVSDAFKCWGLGANDLVPFQLDSRVKYGHRGNGYRQHKRKYPGGLGCKICRNCFECPEEDCIKP